MAGRGPNSSHSPVALNSPVGVAWWTSIGRDSVMDRRIFIASVAGGLLAAPLAAHAQPAGKIYRIGYLSPNNPDLEAFQTGLSRLGWVEGRNFVIEKRFGATTQEGLRTLAAELVAIDVDVIVTISTPAALGAKQ